MPRQFQKDWYHFQPDWPTGTLRVGFTKFLSKNEMCAVRLFIVLACNSKIEAVLDASHLTST